MIRFEKGSPEEERKIEILKEKFHNKLPVQLQEDETIYYRFLKARDFNLDLTETMMENHIADFKLYAVENIEAYAPPEHMKEYFADSFLGFDKEGSVVRYFDGGRFDFKGIFTMFEYVDLANYQFSLYDKDILRMTEQSKKLGKSITQFSYIINVDKLSLISSTSKKVIENVMKTHKLIQDNYPERIKAVYVINTSTYFNLVFAILKNVYANALLKKIHIYKRDDWKEDLLRVIDADVLPAFLGGNRTDPDGNPLCESIIVHGKKIPEDLYDKKSKKSLSQEDGVQKLKVAPFSHAQLTYDVDEINSYIEWEFETKNRDICFALYYNSYEPDPELEEQIPKQKIDAANSAEVGLYKCDKIGTYIIEFDNSYSWFYSKEIFYRIRVVKQPSSGTI